MVKNKSSINDCEYHYACKMLEKKFKRNGILEPGYDESKKRIEKKYGVRR